jgi:hypothetical protein
MSGDWWKVVRPNGVVTNIRNTNREVGDDASTVQVLRRQTVWQSTGDTFRQILRQATGVVWK